MTQTVKEEYWSRFARDYDDNQAFVVGAELLEEIKTRLEALPNLGHVVEFGCGAGYFTESLLARTDRVVATDLSDELLETAARRFVHQPDITFQREDCRNTGLAGGSFDGVFAANIIHVIDKPHLLIKESFRLLKPGGRLIVVSFTNDGMRKLDAFKMGLRFLKKWGRPPRHARSIKLNQLREMAGAYGFRVKTAEIIGHRTKALFLVGIKPAE